MDVIERKSYYEDVRPRPPLSSYKTQGSISPRNERPEPKKQALCRGLSTGTGDLYHKSENISIKNKLSKTLSMVDKLNNVELNSGLKIHDLNRIYEKKQAINAFEYNFKNHINNISFNQQSVNKWSSSIELNTNKYNKYGKLFETPSEVNLMSNSIKYNLNIQSNNQSKSTYNSLKCINEGNTISEFCDNRKFIKTSKNTKTQKRLDNKRNTTANVFNFSTNNDQISSTINNSTFNNSTFSNSSFNNSSTTNIGVKNVPISINSFSTTNVGTKNLSTSIAYGTRTNKKKATTNNDHSMTNNYIPNNNNHVNNKNHTTNNNNHTINNNRTTNNNHTVNKNHTTNKNSRELSENQIPSSSNNSITTTNKNKTSNIDNNRHSTENSTSSKSRSSPISSSGRRLLPQVNMSEQLVEEKRNIISRRLQRKIIRKVSGKKHVCREDSKKADDFEDNRSLTSNEVAKILAMAGPMGVCDSDYEEPSEASSGSGEVELYRSKANKMTSLFDVMKDDVNDSFDDECMRSGGSAIKSTRHNDKTCSSASKFKVGGHDDRTNGEAMKQEGFKPYFKPSISQEFPVKKCSKGASVSSPDDLLASVSLFALLHCQSFALSAVTIPSRHHATNVPFKNNNKKCSDNNINNSNHNHLPAINAEFPFKISKRTLQLNACASSLATTATYSAIVVDEISQELSAKDQVRVNDILLEVAGCDVSAKSCLGVYSLVSNLVASGDDVQLVLARKK